MDNERAEKLVNSLVATQKRLRGLQEGISALQEEMSVAILLARRGKGGTLSAKRKANLKQAFPRITWAFEQAMIYSAGQYHDKVSFAIPGLYKDIQVTFMHATPGGGMARIWAFKDGKKKVIRPASFSNRKEVMKRLEQLSK